VCRCVPVFDTFAIPTVIAFRVGLAQLFLPHFISRLRQRESVRERVLVYIHYNAHKNCNEIHCNKRVGLAQLFLPYLISQLKERDAERESVNESESGRVRR